MTPQAIFFKRSEWVPNNANLPVLIYRQALETAGDGAVLFADRFEANGWRGIWRNGVFDYQHYHVHAHEVLGIAAGKARLLIGGPHGDKLDVMAGDCLVLPAGTGHCRIESSGDFLVIGACPPGQHADIATTEPSRDDLEAIAKVMLPGSDPIDGKSGALCKIWGCADG